MDGQPDPWSVTREDLFEAMREYRERNTPAVLATVVDVEGSAYRRPGAKMLVDPEAESLGAITAGCLEGPVRDLAADVFEARAPSVHTFDLMDEEGWGLGLGCNGIIDVLLEPLDADWDPTLAELAARRSVGRITAVRSENPDIAVGDHVVVDQDWEVLDGTDDALPGTVVDAVEAQLAELRATEVSATVTVETDAGEIDAFLDLVTPAPDLLLFGTQNDVHPVARIGHQVGFRVVVASARGARSDPEQFPNAHEVRSVHPTALADAVDVPERTYAVVMSHNALEDRLALASLLDTTVPYVGLMGPRERFEDIREDLATEEGRELTAEELDRIATPVGLDLGGGEPTQIALSIVAEALAVHNDRNGGRLEDRKGPIHDRVAPSE
jgi:xanthine dehydrogenase accessory factor